MTYTSNGSISARTEAGTLLDFRRPTRPVFRYYFLAAKFDAGGFATTLRGTTLGYDSAGGSKVWDKLKATGMLPPPIPLEDDELKGHRLELYPSLGLAVHELSGEAREYYLIDPTRWNDLRVDNCNLFQNNKARIYLHPQD
jgi:hypothetical protein